MKKKKRNKKSRKDGTFTLAAKRFIISCMLILSLTGLAAGIAYADGNSRKMAMGEIGLDYYWKPYNREKQLELSINEKTAATFNLSLPKKYRDYLYFLPAPLSGIVWLADLIA